MEFRWRMTVEESFVVSGRGTVIVGHVEGTASPHEPAVVERPDGGTVRLEAPTVELPRCVQDGRHEDRVALVPGEVGGTSVVPGTVVRSVLFP